MLVVFMLDRIGLRDSMRRSRLLAAFSAFLLLPAFGHAQETDRAGLYEREDGYPLTANLRHLSGNRYAIALSTVVPMTTERTGCAGSLEGEVAIDGDKATLTVPNEGFIAGERESISNRRFCEVNLEFHGEYRLDLEEVSGCSYYHGAACEFSGTVLHEASGL